jgi:hypothetical protein
MSAPGAQVACDKQRPFKRGEAMTRVSRLFELNREGLNVQRGLMFVGFLVVPGSLTFPPGRRLVDKVTG